MTSCSITRRLLINTARSCSFVNRIDGKFGARSASVEPIKFYLLILQVWLCLVTLTEGYWKPVAALSKPGVIHQPAIAADGAGVWCFVDAGADAAGRVGGVAGGAARNLANLDSTLEPAKNVWSEAMRDSTNREGGNWEPRLATTSPRTPRLAACMSRTSPVKETSLASKPAAPVLPGTRSLSNSVAEIISWERTSSRMRSA